MKKLALLSSFQDVDFHEQVVLAVADGTNHYYANLYANYLEGEDAKQYDDLDDDNQEDQFEGTALLQSAMTQLLLLALLANV